MFLGLGHSTLKPNKDELRFSWFLFCAHLVSIAAVMLCHVAALRGSSILLYRPAHFSLSAIVVLAIALLGLACVPLSAWIESVRTMRSLWVAAILAGVAAGILRHPFQLLWNPSSFSPGVALRKVTFHAVQSVLGYLLPDLIAAPSTFILGTPRFLVFIAPECSGLEGLGLVLVFTVVWLWHFRKESRFPQALLLIPGALVSVWLLNIVRIAAIILIGNAGSPDVAMVGFHSQAGWIAFTAVALLFSMATRKILWVRLQPVQAGVTDGSPEISERGESPATAAYLMPLLAILAASFVSMAASGSFEWLYPLRFVAGAVAIWYFRREYRSLDWRFDWLAPLTGTGVFLVWIAHSLWSHGSSAHPLAVALATLSPALRSTWIAIYVAAVITTAPVAEELAFRGYLARPLIGREFNAVPFSSLTWLSIGISSLAFGLLQGNQIAGIIAGAAYALMLKRRGRSGDAVVAHVTGNVLLAGWILLRGDWALW